MTEHDQTFDQMWDPDEERPQNRPRRNYTLEAIARGVLAIVIVGCSCGITLAVVLGYATMGEGTREMSLLVLGAINTLAATVVTHYFRSTD